MTGSYSGAERRDIERLRERLRGVYWIGGSPGAGKSTIARMLADKYGLLTYATDDAMSEHVRRITVAEAPYLKKFKEMDMDERWLNRSPEIMLDTFHWFRGEGFGLIVQDLLDLAESTPVVAEGFRLLPPLVQPLLAKINQAVWLLPTPRFRTAAFDSRGSTWEIPNKTSDPARARQNIQARDQMFTDRLAEQAERLKLHTVEPDLGMATDDLCAEVARLFGLSAKRSANCRMRHLR